MTPDRDAVGDRYATATRRALAGEGTGALALVGVRALYPGMRPAQAADVVVPHTATSARR